MAKQLICSSCGHVGDTKKAVKGSLGVEIFLWLCFIIPGIIYSLWRQSTYHKACPVCGNTNLIPVDSPVGQRLMKEQGKTPEEIQTAVVAGSKFSLKQKIWIGLGIFLGISVIINLL